MTKITDITKLLEQCDTLTELCNDLQAELGHKHIPKNYALKLETTHTIVQEFLYKKQSKLRTALSTALFLS